MTARNKTLFFTGLLLILLAHSTYAQVDGKDEVKNKSWSLEGSEKSDSAEVNDVTQESEEKNKDAGLLEQNPSKIESPNPKYLRSKGAGNNPGPSGNGVYDLGSDKYGTMPQDVIVDTTSTSKEKSK